MKKTIFIIILMFTFALIRTQCILEPDKEFIYSDTTMVTDTSILYDTTFIFDTTLIFDTTFTALKPNTTGVSVASAKFIIFKVLDACAPLNNTNLFPLISQLKPSAIDKPKFVYIPEGEPPPPLKNDDNIFDVPKPLTDPIENEKNILQVSMKNLLFLP